MDGMQLFDRHHLSQHPPPVWLRSSVKAPRARRKKHLQLVLVNRQARRPRKLHVLSPSREARRESKLRGRVPLSPHHRPEVGSAGEFLPCRLCQTALLQRLSPRNSLQLYQVRSESSPVPGVVLDLGIRPIFPHRRRHPSGQTMKMVCCDDCQTTSRC